MDVSLVLIFISLFLPLSVSLFLFFLQKRLTDNAIKIIAISSAVIIFIISVVIFGKNYNQPSLSYSVKWITLNGIPSIRVGVLLNKIASIMLVLVSLVSLLVQIFSIQYMKGDKGYGRYFAYLSFFTFSMLGVVMADNLLFIFVFWELVSFSSYLLIGFWFDKPSAIQASKKAFVINRIGDVGFVIGIMILWSLFKTLSIQELEIISNLSNDPGSTVSYWIFFAGLGLFAGCVGKSAQFPLQIWLPDAMEGPTPVSALIHAATMVAAGVFLLARVFFLLNLDILNVIAFIGAITAFMGAIAALSQYDIKKVLAFSTISQLGYMVMGMGLGAYEASLFHLVTHAFFKAGLFLSAGAVIYSLHEASHHVQNEHFDAQDMRIMGGLRRKLPFTFVIYCLTTASLIGLPLFSGFLSKDAIIAYSLGWAKVMNTEIGPICYIVPALAIATIVLTGFYMTRQLILVFFGTFRLEKISDQAARVKESIKEVPLSMKIPLGILGGFSLFIPFSFNPFSTDNSFLLNLLSQDLQLFPSYLFIERNLLIEFIHRGVIKFHDIVWIISITFSSIGILAAIIKYSKNVDFEEKSSYGFFARLSLNNWYLDKLYNRTILNLALAFSRLVVWIDTAIIDRVINFIGYFTVVFSLVIAWLDKIFVDGMVNLTVYTVGRVGLLARSFQGGKIQYYFIIAILSFILIVYFILL